VKSYLERLPRYYWRRGEDAEKTQHIIHYGKKGREWQCAEHKCHAKERSKLSSRRAVHYHGPQITKSQRFSGGRILGQKAVRGDI